jgi:hypothetical protein
MALAVRQVGRRANLRTDRVPLAVVSVEVEHLGCASAFVKDLPAARAKAKRAAQAKPAA